MYFFSIIFKLIGPFIQRIEFAKPPEYREDGPVLTLFWAPTDSCGVLKQTIRACTVLDVNLSSLPEPVKFQVLEIIVIHYPQMSLFVVGSLQLWYFY